MYRCTNVDTQKDVFINHKKYAFSCWFKGTKIIFSPTPMMWHKVKMRSKTRPDGLGRPRALFEKRALGLQSRLPPSRQALASFAHNFMRIKRSDKTREFLKTKTLF